MKTAEQILNDKKGEWMLTLSEASKQIALEAMEEYASQFKSLPEITDEKIRIWAQEFAQGDDCYSKVTVTDFLCEGAKWYRSELKRRINESR